MSRARASMNLLQKIKVWRERRAQERRILAAAEVLGQERLEALARHAELLALLERANRYPHPGDSP